jgi:hypothetical protein
VIGAVETSIVSGFFGRNLPTARRLKSSYFEVYVLPATALFNWPFLRRWEQALLLSKHEGENSNEFNKPGNYGRCRIS